MQKYLLDKNYSYSKSVLQSRDCCILETMDGSTRAGGRRIPKVFQHHKKATSRSKQDSSSQQPRARSGEVQQLLPSLASTLCPVLTRLDEIPLVEDRDFPGPCETDLAPLRMSRRHKEKYSTRSHAREETSLRNTRGGKGKRNEVASLLSEVRDMVGRMKTQEQQTGIAIQKKTRQRNKEPKKKARGDESYLNPNPNRQRSGRPNLHPNERQRGPTRHSLNLSMEDYDNGLRRVEQRTKRHMKKMDNCEFQK